MEPHAKSRKRSSRPDHTLRPFLPSVQLVRISRSHEPRLCDCDAGLSGLSCLRGMSRYGSYNMYILSCCYPFLFFLSAAAVLNWIGVAFCDCSQRQPGVVNLHVGQVMNCMPYDLVVVGCCSSLLLLLKMPIVAILSVPASSTSHALDMFACILRSVLPFPA